jgi:transcriptional regulator with XRE-family HTH domain
MTIEGILTETDSLVWLHEQLEKTGLGSISQLAEVTKINKGTLSKYFRGLQRPSIDVIEPLCTALKVSPETLLRALNALGSSQKKPN